MSLASMPASLYAFWAATCVALKEVKDSLWNSARVSLACAVEATLT